MFICFYFLTRLSNEKYHKKYLRNCLLISLLFLLFYFFLSLTNRPNQTIVNRNSYLEYGCWQQKMSGLLKFLLFTCYQTNGRLKHLLEAVFVIKLLALVGVRFGNPQQLTASWQKSTHLQKRPTALPITHKEYSLWK